MRSGVRVVLGHTERFSDDAPPLRDGLRDDLLVFTRYFGYSLQ